MTEKTQQESSNLKVLSFTKRYKSLNTEAKKKDEVLFNLGVLMAYTSEIKNGFMVTKQLRTTKEGTNFKYKGIDSIEEANDYEKIVESLLDKLRESAASFAKDMDNESECVNNAGLKKMIVNCADNDVSDESVKEMIDGISNKHDDDLVCEVNFENKMENN